MRLDHEARTALHGDEDFFTAKMGVENMLQNELINQLVGGQEATVDDLGTTQLDGVATHHYQRTERRNDRVVRRTEIWIDPASGFPVRSESYVAGPSGALQLHMAYERIEPNAAPPGDLHAIEPPRDYAVAEQPRDPEAVHLAVARWQGHEAIVRYAFNIDDRAVLICWAYAEAAGTADPEAFLTPHRQMTLIPEGVADWTSDHRVMRVVPAGDRQWVWSLVVSEDTAAVDRGLFTAIFGQGEKPLRIHLRPLRFDPNELSDLLHEAQSRRPGAATAPPITMDSIREEIRQSEEKFTGE